MFSTGAAPSFASRVAYRTSTDAAASSIALKRKRDDVIAPRSAPRNRASDGQKVRELANLSLIFHGHSGLLDSSSTSGTARLLPSGDLVLLSGSNMSFVLNALNHSKATLVNSLSEDCDVGDLERELSVSSGFGAARGLIASSTKGAVLLYAVESDGSVTSSQRGVALGDEGDRISCVLHAGDCYVVGTAQGELYVIRHETGAGKESVLFMERLRRAQSSVFMGLFQTGVKMLGLGSEGAAKGRGSEVRKLLISEDQPGGAGGGAYDKLLFAVSGSSLSLWTAWTQPGEEQLLWEVSLRDILSQDLLEALKGAGAGAAGGTDRDCSRVTILDVELLPAESESSCGILLVLSTFTEDPSAPPTDRQAPSPPSLWLHVLSFASTSFHKTQRTKAAPGPLLVRGRLRVAGSVMAAQDTARRPKLHRLLMPQSWRLYISWISHPTNTFRTTHIDVKNLPNLSDPEYREEQREADGTEAGCEDSGIKGEDVLSCSSVAGEEGVCMLLRDGTVRLSSPPLQQRNSRSRFLLKLSHASSRLSPEQLQAQTEQLEEGGNLILSVALGEVSLSDIATRLRAALADSSEEDLSDMVVRTSGKIANRASTGQNWGISLSSGLEAGRGRGRAQCQLARRLISDKLAAHTQLLDVVHETGIFDVMLPAQIDELSRTHQRLLGSGGLCAALEEAQQRVGGDPNPASDSTSPNPLSSGGLSDLSFLAQERAGGREGEGTDPDSEARNTTLRSANVQFLHTASKEGLRVVSLGMERAVTQSASRSAGDDLASKGLSTADVFFSEAIRFSDGLMSIASALRDERTSLSNRGVLLPAAYGVASYLLATVQAAQGEGGWGGGSCLGSRNPKASLMCDEQVNKAVLEVIGVFTSACEALVATAVAGGQRSLYPSSSGSLTLTLTQSRGFGQGLTRAGLAPSGPALEEFFECLGLRRVQEGRRLKALCQAVLNSHVLKATVTPSAARRGGSAEDLERQRVDADLAVGGVGVTEVWREGFALAKSCCIDSLLRVGHTVSAFDLSAQFLHPRGLLEALDLCDSDATSASPLAMGLTSRFREIVRRQAALKGTEKVPLATYCMQWLEAKGRPISVLEIGKLAPEQLASFLECRPHIGWVHHVASQNYVAAATAAVEHGYRETRHATATTLLSMAKLSAMLASTGTRRPSPFSSSPSSSSSWDKRDVNHVCVSGSDAAREATANLAVLGAQTVILEGDVNLLRDCGDVANRLPASVIIDKLILLAQTRGAGLDLEGSRRRGETYADVDSNASSSAVADTVRYLSLALGQLSIRKDCLEALGGSEDTQRDLNVAEGQLREVWATALRVQECLWVNLAASSYEKEKGADISLGGAEENMMFGTVLGRLSTECRQSVAEDLLRADVCPTISPGGGQDADWQEGGRHEGVHLDSVMESLGFADSPHAKRITYLIRGCLTAGIEDTGHAA